MNINSFLVGQPTNKKISNIIEVTLGRKLDLILEQNRMLRQDNVDMKLMINKLLIDKHLQMQVDEYFTEDSKQEDI